jgi:hypothetical protein
MSTFFPLPSFTGVSTKTNSALNGARQNGNKYLTKEGLDKSPFLWYNELEQKEENIMKKPFDFVDFFCIIAAILGFLF